MPGAVRKTRELAGRRLVLVPPPLVRFVFEAALRRATSSTVALWSRSPGDDGFGHLPLVVCNLQFGDFVRGRRLDLAGIHPLGDVLRESEEGQGSDRPPWPRRRASRRDPVAVQPWRSMSRRYALPCSTGDKVGADRVLDRLLGQDVRPVISRSTNSTRTRSRPASLQARSRRSPTRTTHRPRSASWRTRMGASWPNRVMLSASRGGRPRRTPHGAADSSRSTESTGSLGERPRFDRAVELVGNGDARRSAGRVGRGGRPSGRCWPRTSSAS